MAEYLKEISLWIVISVIILAIADYLESSYVNNFAYWFYLAGILNVTFYQMIVNK
jgi:hypothetical protein